MNPIDRSMLWKLFWGPGLGMVIGNLIGNAILFLTFQTTTFLLSYIGLAFIMVGLAGELIDPIDR